MKRMRLLLLLSLCLLPLSACQKDGPAEEAGESIDRAVDDASDALEDAGEELDDAVDGH